MMMILLWVLFAYFGVVSLYGMVYVPACKPYSPSDWGKFLFSVLALSIVIFFLLWTGWR